MSDLDQMNEIIAINVPKKVGERLTLPTKKVQAVTDLLNDGNTVPFIARYRKEATGNLDEVQIRDIQTVTKQLT
jgi:uncharacterized protein